jgi:hypothetical protein
MIPLSPTIQALVRHAARLSLGAVIAETQAVSIEEPHNVFYIVALPCMGCHRHSIGFAALVPEKGEKKRPRYTICIIMAGEIVPRGGRM